MKSSIILILFSDKEVFKTVNVFSEEKLKNVAQEK